MSKHFFLKVVMLHIKLKGMQHRSCSVFTHTYGIILFEILSSHFYGIFFILTAFVSFIYDHIKVLICINLPEVVICRLQSMVET